MQNNGRIIWQSCYKQNEQNMLLWRVHYIARIYHSGWYRVIPTQSHITEHLHLIDYVRMQRTDALLSVLQWIGIAKKHKIQMEWHTPIYKITNSYFTTNAYSRLLKALVSNVYLKSTRDWCHNSLLWNMWSLFKIWWKTHRQHLLPSLHLTLSWDRVLTMVIVNNIWYIKVTLTTMHIGLMYIAWCQVMLITALINPLRPSDAYMRQ